MDSRLERRQTLASLILIPFETQYVTPVTQTFLIILQTTYCRDPAMRNV